MDYDDSIEAGVRLTEAVAMLNYAEFLAKRCLLDSDFVLFQERVAKAVAELAKAKELLSSPKEEDTGG